MHTPFIDNGSVYPIYHIYIPLTFVNFFKFLFVKKWCIHYKKWRSPRSSCTSSGSLEREVKRKLPSASQTASRCIASFKQVISGGPVTTTLLSIFISGVRIWRLFNSPCVRAAKEARHYYHCFELDLRLAQLMKDALRMCSNLSTHISN